MWMRAFCLLNAIACSKSFYGRQHGLQQTTRLRTEAATLALASNSLWKRMQRPASDQADFDHPSQSSGSIQDRRRGRLTLRASAAGCTWAVFKTRCWVIELPELRAAIEADCTSPVARRRPSVFDRSGLSSVLAKVASSSCVTAQLFRRHLRRAVSKSNKRVTR